MFLATRLVFRSITLPLKITIRPCWQWCRCSELKVDRTNSSRLRRGLAGTAFTVLLFVAGICYPVLFVIVRSPRVMVALLYAGTAVRIGSANTVAGDVRFLVGVRRLDTPARDRQVPGGKRRRRSRLRWWLHQRPLFAWGLAAEAAFTVPVAASGICCSYRWHAIADNRHQCGGSNTITGHTASASFTGVAGCPDCVGVPLKNAAVW